MLATSTAGPSYIVAGWTVWVIITGSTAGTVLSLVALWRTVLGPLARRRAVLDAIADAFTPDDKSPSLSQQLHQLAEGQQAVLTSQGAYGTKLSELYAYTHANMHKLRSEVAAISNVDGSAHRVVEALNNTVVELKQVRASIPKPRAKPRGA